MRAPLEPDRAWDFESPLLPLGSLDAHPNLASLWQRFKDSGWLVERDWLTERGLRVLPLHEWRFEYVQNLFQVLREAGSTRGYLLDSPLGSQYHDPGTPPSELRECALDEPTADLIRRRMLFEFDRMFVDESQQCIVLIWFTDFVLLCMPPALFDRWLALEQIYFCPEEGGPIAASFQQALAQTFRASMMLRRRCGRAGNPSLPTSPGSLSQPSSR